MSSAACLTLLVICLFGSISQISSKTSDTEDGPSQASVTEAPQANANDNNNTPEVTSAPAIVPSSQPAMPDTTKEPGKSVPPSVTKRNDTTTATVGNSRNGAQGIVSCLNMSVVTLLIVATVHL
ncbi:uncharacterized protein LOC112572152 [Pomacea canaliculata]|uniref:uncharacterized protein LOC112572152 n=1 Tax=Pomacea canaliculata TaxID=400727 RepID=UPI000D734E1D|nr:uncharacterized protein LOC112572152 [Pomacea canaliculata]